MRAEPNTVTPGPTCDRASNESTNSAMIRKIRQGSSLINEMVVLLFTLGKYQGWCRKQKKQTRRFDAPKGPPEQPARQRRAREAGQGKIRRFRTNRPR